MLSHWLVFMLLARVEAVLDGYRMGTKAASWAVAWQVVGWVMGC